MQDIKISKSLREVEKSISKLKVLNKKMESYCKTERKLLVSPSKYIKKKKYFINSLDDIEETTE